MEITLSDAGRLTAGLILISIVTIEMGGAVMLRVVRGQIPMTPFQQRFARAGHAHAGVLVTLGLVCLVLTEATALTGLAEWVARTGVAVSAILMSAGFFLSSAGKDVHEPNLLVALLGVGAAVLAAGVVTLGVGLLTAG